MPRKPGEKFLNRRKEKRRERNLERQRQYNSSRPDIHRLYNTTEWKRLSKWYRKNHPLCEECQRHGLVKPADLVDHIVELSDGGEFLDETNLQSLCISCHNRKTAREARLRREGRGGSSF